jgi:outer membrane protein assembly factor BamB
MIANGKFYAASIGGIVYCYDVKDGTLLWNYTCEDPYAEEQFSNNWWLRPMFVTDDYAYFGHLEHSANNPRPRGAPFICLNATSGELVWRIDGAFRQSRWGGRAILGDSIIATQDTYNQQVYAIGKGPSRITVTAPNVGVQQGSSLIISGTVTDVSPGTEDYAIRARFPNGVPAMSDASQSDWMLYVYKQFTKPTDAVGVDVSLYVVDSNGNYRSIGTATSDASGKYSLQWTPDIPGKYTVYATFAGSGAFYGSSDQTAFCVDPAADPTAAPTPQPLSTSEMYFVPAIAGLFVLIIVIAAVMIVLLLKKRP